MASVTSASTLQDLKDGYLNNCGYAEDQSTSKAKAFITYCRALQLKLPREGTHGGSGSGAESFVLDHEALAKAIAEAREWLSSQTDAASGGSGVVHTSFEEFRN